MYNRSTARLQAFGQGTQGTVAGSFPIRPLALNHPAFFVLAGSSKKYAPISLVGMFSTRAIAAIWALLKGCFPLIRRLNVLGTMPAALARSFWL